MNEITENAELVTLYEGGTPKYVRTHVDHIDGFNKINDKIRDNEDNIETVNKKTDTNSEQIKILDTKTSDTGWLDGSSLIASGISHRNVRYRKIGNQVFFRGDVFYNGTEVNVPLLKFPTGCESKITFPVILPQTGSGFEIAKIEVNSASGIVLVKQTTINYRIFLNNLTYFID